MRKKNDRKFRCDECNHEQFESMTPLSFRTRLKCPMCGSVWYEPHSVEARNVIEKGNSWRKTHKEKRNRHV